jgi:RNA polymerase sigma factor (sigma-70 family)
VTAEAEFSAVFQRHHRDVERFLARRAPDLPVADLAAEVFLIAWRRWDRLPVDRALPWLYAVARNVLANELRGELRHRRLVDRVAALSPPQVEADHAEAISDRAVVAGAFDQLGEADREVLRLVVWERLSMSDAAHVLGCGTAAFAMRLARARRRLRAALARTSVPTLARSTTGDRT